jgi:hypothetical protein
VWAIDRDLPAHQALRDAAYLIDTRGGAVSTSLLFGWLLESATTLGLHGELRLHTAKLMQRSRCQDRHGHAMGCRALAAHAVSGGDLAAAERLLRRAEHSAALRASPREQALNRLTRARLASSAGQTAEARALVEQACDAFESMQMRWHLQQAQSLDAAL